MQLATIKNSTVSSVTIQFADHLIVSSNGYDCCTVMHRKLRAYMYLFMVCLVTVDLGHLPKLIVLKFCLAKLITIDAVTSSSCHMFSCYC